MADGKITLKVGLDTKDLGTEVKKLANRFDAATQSVEKQTKKVDELKAHLAELNKGTADIKDSGVARLQTQLDKANASIERTTAEIAQLNAQSEAIAAGALKTPSGATLFSKGEEQQLDAIVQKLDTLEPKLNADKQRAAELGEQLKGAVGAATQSEIEATNQKLAEAETKLEGLKVKAEDAGNRLSTKMEETHKATSEVASGFEKLGNRLRGMVKRVFLFSLLTKALRGVRETIGNVLMSDTELQSALYQLQAAFWAAFAPIFSYVVPALKTLVNWMTAAVVAVGKLIAALTGKSYSAMLEQGKAIKERAAAYGKSASGAKKDTKAVKDNTKALQKQLAAFDELNILQEDKGDTSAGAGGDAGAGGLAGAATEGAGFDTSKITADLSALMMAIGGALAAVGLILLFAGHIGIGLGFIIAGASAFSVGLISWRENDYGGKISQRLSTIMVIAASALAAIGLVVLFSGNIALGLGFIAAGAAIFGVQQLSTSKYDGKDISAQLMIILNAASYYILCIGLLVMLIPGTFLVGLGMVVAGLALLKYTEATIGSGEAHSAIDNFFKNNLKLVMGVGTALLLIGLLLCVCAPAFPLGLALIFAGAGLIWKAAVLSNTDAKNALVKFFADNQMLFIGIGAAMMVIGFMIMFISGGAAMMLGLGILFEGAALVYSAANADWNQMRNRVTTAVDAVGSWLKTWGLLALGAILAFSGIGGALGISLMRKAGANLTKAQDPVWSTITNKIKEVCGDIKTYWDGHIAKYFTAEWWGNLAKTAVNGFVKFFINGLNTLISKINSFGFNMPEVLGGKHIGFNIPKISVPALARGAVIPPNREFMAVLGDQKHGTNIEAPLDTIKQAVREVLASEERSGGGNQTIILELDGREVGRTFGKAIDREKNRTGSSFVKTKLVFG